MKYATCFTCVVPIVIMLVLSVGCSGKTKAPEAAVIKEPGIQHKPAIQTYFKDLPPAEGSLYTDKVGNLYVDNQAKSVGDTVIVDIVENATSTLGATTEAKRTSTVNAGIPNFFGLAESLNNKNANLNTTNLVRSSYTNDTEGEGTITRNGQVTASIGARVMAVLPNGNLSIYGARETKVNNETQYIFVSGIVRPEDIDANNRVKSTSLADTKIEYYGKGVLADKQKAGWLSRMLDKFWPL